MSRKAKIISVVTAAAVLVIDQITKMLVAGNMTLGESVVLIPRVFNLTYIHNRGVAFGMFQNHTAVFIVLTALLIAAGVFVIAKGYCKHPLIFWAVMLIISGGTGNLIDRIFRGGNVIDFIETAFIDFPVFNIADCAVTVGAALLIVYLLKDIFRPKKTERQVGD